MYSQYKNTIKHLSNTILATLLLTITSASLADDSGAINVVEGYAIVISANGDIRRLTHGDKIANDDVINTGCDSRVSLILNNDNAVSLESLSSYNLVDGNVKPLDLNSEQSGVIYANCQQNGATVKRSLSRKSPTLSTATSAGGALSADNVAPTTPTAGGSPTN